MNGRSSTVKLNVTPLRPPSSGDDVSRSLDELLRRTLRVADPANPAEIAEALRRRYGAEAARIDQESMGLPVAGGTTLDLVVRAETPAAGTSAGDREYERLERHLRADLDELIDHQANRDWRPELEGWRSTLLREFADGADAARWGQDPAQRDRAMLAVRKHSEYGRLARLASVLHVKLSREYRRLATTLDDSASALRILLGQAIYGAGLADGGLILNVPILDLRQRADALVDSLRGLVDGGGAEVRGTADWGWRYKSYNSLLKILDDNGASDLRILLREEPLRLQLDAILDGVSGASQQGVSSDGLRRMAATLPIEINRIQRLYEIISPLFENTGKDALHISPELSRFTQALSMFVHALVDCRVGERLVDLAMPLPMTVTQAKVADEGRNRLRELIATRGELARWIEEYLPCCSGNRDELAGQALLDRFLYDLDRAIDLYALGTAQNSNWGENERRASLVALLAQKAKRRFALRESESGTERQLLLSRLLDGLSKQLNMPESRSLSSDEQEALLKEQRNAESHFQLIVQRLVPRGAPAAESVKQEIFDLLSLSKELAPRTLTWMIEDIDPPQGVEQLLTHLVHGDSRRKAIFQPPIVTVPEPAALRRDQKTALAFLSTTLLALGAVQEAASSNTDVKRAVDVWSTWRNVLCGQEKSPTPLPGFQPWSMEKDKDPNKYSEKALEARRAIDPTGILAGTLDELMLWSPKRSPEDGGGTVLDAITGWVDRITYCMSAVLATQLLADKPASPNPKTPKT